MADAEPMAKAEPHFSSAFPARRERRRTRRPFKFNATFGLGCEREGAERTGCWPRIVFAFT